MRGFSRFSPLAARLVSRAFIRSPRAFARFCKRRAVKKYAQIAWERMGAGRIGSCTARQGPNRNAFFGVVFLKSGDRRRRFVFPPSLVAALVGGSFSASSPTDVPLEATRCLLRPLSASGVIVFVQLPGVRAMAEPPGASARGADARTWRASFFLLLSSFLVPEAEGKSMHAFFFRTLDLLSDLFCLLLLFAASRHGPVSFSLSVLSPADARERSRERERGARSRQSRCREV